MHRSLEPKHAALRIGVYALLVVVAAALLAACGNDTNANTDGTTNGTSSPKVIKIGSLWPLTGPVAKIGQECVQVVEMAVDEINAQGGIKSMGGAKLEIVSGDTGSAPDIGLGEARRLVEQEKVDIITGTYQSTVAIPVSQYCERARVPFLVGIAAADVITESGLQWTFRTAQTTHNYGKGQVELAVALPTLVEGGAFPEVKTAAVLWENSEFGQAVHAANLTYLVQHHIEVVADVSYDAMSPDLTTQVSRVKAANPDVVLTSTWLNDAILIRRARAKLGMEQPFIDAVGGTSVDSFGEDLGPLADGQLLMTDFEPETANEAGQQAYNDFKEQYRGDFSSYATAYQGIYVIAKALENAGSTDPDKLQAALVNVKLVAADGDKIILPMDTLQFDEKHQLKSEPLGVQWQNNVMVPVFPDAYAKYPVLLYNE